MSDGLKLRRVNATFGGTALSTEGVAGFRNDGQTVTDEVQTFRATAPTFYNMGNNSVTIAFTVWREFDSLLLLETFIADHFGAIPKEGDLVLTLGSGGTTTTRTSVGAVLTLCSHAQDPEGLGVNTSYVFRGPPLTP